MTAILRTPLTWLWIGYAGLVITLPYAAAVADVLLPDQSNVIYVRRPFVELALIHLGLVCGATLISVLLGVGVAIAVTTRALAEFRPLAESIAAIGQIVPPVAVLAMAVPLIGFGAWPTLIALTLYGLLPIMQAAIGALTSVPASAIEAARGMGFSPWQRLIKVKLPLAFPAMMGGIRVAVTISIGTATVGSVVGATSLGDPIIAGLVNGNNAYVIQGCAVVAGLAVLVDLVLRKTEQALAAR